MQAYVIGIVLLCAPAAFGMFSPSIVPEFQKYRNDCIAKVGITNTDVINQIKSRVIPVDGSADEFAVCMLQTFRVLNEDAMVNPNVDSYFLLTDTGDPIKIAATCVPKSGTISGKEAMRIIRCLRNHQIVVLM